MNIPFSPANIKTELDVQAFFEWLVNDQYLNFHPDTPFEDYVYYDTEDCVYSDKVAAILNTVMDKCFEIKDDVYEIGLEVIKEYVHPEMGIDYGKN